MSTDGCLRVLAALLLPSAIAAAAEPPFVDMFEAGDFSAWHVTPNGKGWAYTDGVIHRHQKGAGSLISNRRYKDFELVFEWKIAPGGNSGIIYRRQHGGGLEYQVLDDERHRAGKREDGRTAALYNLFAPAPDKPYRPAGQWNTGRIVARGDHVEHWLNGQKVVDAQMTGDDWRRRYQASKYGKYKRKNFGKVASPITFQDHGGEVWYRNVKIQEFTAEQPAQQASDK